VAAPGSAEAPPSELTDDALTRDYRVWQRRRGHRYSIDDVATAWEAARARPDAERVLDLGCGIGSVLLMLAWALPRARLVGVEALGMSHALARRNVARNDLGERVAVHRGDLREPAVRRALLAGGPFDLVTGTPPYFPPGSATPSPDPQRAHARVELRGGVEDYLAAAAALVAPGGIVAICAAAGDARVLAGARAAGLVPRTSRPIVPRAGNARGPLFAVWTLIPGTCPPGTDPALVVHPPLVARDAGGRRTEAERAVRGFFGLAAHPGEPPSP